jgi:hypothetical protein
MYRPERVPRHSHKYSILSVNIFGCGVLESSFVFSKDVVELLCRSGVRQVLATPVPRERLAFFQMAGAAIRGHSANAPRFVSGAG